MYSTFKILLVLETSVSGCDTNPAHGVLFRIAAEYSAAMCGVSPGTLVIWPWLLLSMIYCCALRPWSQICVTYQSFWFLGSVALSSCAGASYHVHVGWRHIYEMDMEHFTNQNVSVVVVKCWLSGFVVFYYYYYYY